MAFVRAINVFSRVKAVVYDSITIHLEAFYVGLILAIYGAILDDFVRVSLAVSDSCGN